VSEIFAISAMIVMFDEGRNLPFMGVKRFELNG
jgi:hypothetical protein